MKSPETIEKTSINAILIRRNENQFYLSARGLAIQVTNDS